MAEYKWSKGTWEVRPQGNQLSVWAGEGVRFTVAEISINRSIEAAGTPSAEERANAALIAAAPYLVEVVSELIDSINKRWAGETARKRGNAVSPRTEEAMKAGRKLLRTLKGEE